MSKLPLLSGKEVCKALSRIGFHPIRQRGSHLYMQHPDGRSTVVPMYAEIDRNLLKKILKEAETSENEFTRNL
ncbi:MAG: type II toxin-antitoxin system HicA family toxin [Candidatus Aenigmatarchaeota archaeon]